MARGRGFSPPDIYFTMVGDIPVTTGPLLLQHGGRYLSYYGDLTSWDHKELLETTGVHVAIRYRKSCGQRMLTLKGPLRHIEAARQFALDIIYLRSKGVPEPRPGKWGWENELVWDRHGYAHRTQQPWDAHDQWHHDRYDVSSSPSDGGNRNEQQEAEQEDEEHEEEEEAEEFQQEAMNGQSSQTLHQDSNEVWAKSHQTQHFELATPQSPSSTAMDDLWEQWESVDMLPQTSWQPPQPPFPTDATDLYAVLYKHLS